MAEVQFDVAAVAATKINERKNRKAMILPSRDAPFPADWSVKYGLSIFMLENGYQIETYNAPRTPAKILGIRFGVPNPPHHRWAIKLHDLHHIATGYGTDLRGEGELGAWEARRGLRPLGLYVGAIVISAMLSGFAIAPVRANRAFRDSGSHESLFHMGSRTYESLLAMTIGELRKILRIPEAGQAVGRVRGLNAMAPRSRNPNQ